jgi:hypothetical protein
MAATQLSELLVYGVTSGNSFWRNKINGSFDATRVITNLMCTSCRNKDDITRILEYSNIKVLLNPKIEKMKE